MGQIISGRPAARNGIFQKTGMAPGTSSRALDLGAGPTASFPQDKEEAAHDKTGIAWILVVAPEADR
jgi:hypothetical protein